MKQKVFLMTALCVLFSAAAVFAQTKTDFSGNWTLDVSKSKLDERQRIESGTMNVTQTDKDITFKTDFKRAPRPDNGGGMAAGGGNGQGGGMGRGGMMGGGANQAITYTLDGKEVTSQIGSGDRTGTAKTQSKWDGGKLNLTSVRTFTTPNGDSVSTTLKETWELADGGKVLKLHRETESPRGTQTSDFYYTKS